MLFVLVFGPVLAYFVHQRMTEPSYPLRGASAAHYLRTHTFSPDPVTRVACTTNACQIWFAAESATGLHGADMELALDANTTSFWGGDGGVTSVGRWTFHLRTRDGVLSAACTTGQAQHLGDESSFTKAELNRWCPSFWVPR